MKSFVSSVIVMIVSAGMARGSSFASAVVSYDAGSAPASRTYMNDFWATVATVPLTNPSAALGGPAVFVTEPYQTGADRVVSPFVPAANEDQVVSIGEGGQLTLRLDRYALIGAGPEIGLFTNTAVADTWVETPPGSWNYVAQEIVASPMTTFGVHNVTIEVSRDGNTWVSLGSRSVGNINNAFIDSATAYATSTAGLTASDPSKPYTASLASLAGQTYAQVKTMLDGSAGGTWLDLSDTGLDEVGFIRLSLPDDGNALTHGHFELDSVSVNGDLIGASVPEPASLAALALGAAFLRRRRAAQR